MGSRALRVKHFWVIVVILTLPTILLGQKGLSHVRVVRLSYVRGTVGVKRPGSTEWAKAQVNTPIQEGFEISTSGESYAEVEFENGSTARLGEFTKLNFDQLAMDEDGNKLNRLTFEQGYATFHFLPDHNDAYSVKVAETTLSPNGKSEFRTDLEHGKARVEVFTGSIEVAASAKTVKLGKDKSLEFDTGPQKWRSIPSRVLPRIPGISGRQREIPRRNARLRTRRFQREDRFTAGATSTPTANGDSSRDSGMAGRLLRPPDGRPTAWGCGASIRAWVIRGFPASPGVGYLITMAFGISLPALAGFGCRVAMGRGPRHWSVGIRARDGSAGRHAA